ncbi:MAG: hypothetical protein ACI4RM_04890 [Ruminococcus sp.]
MKTKRIFTALLAGALSVTAVVSASAATLSDVTPDGGTEVTAKIVDPGTVSYTITIPDKVDFGTLEMPDVDADSYTYQSFRVEATEINIPSNRAVSVYMKDSTATDNQFYLTQKDVDVPFTIPYDVYSGVVNDDNRADLEAINTTDTPSTYGYHITTFLSGTQGKTKDVTLALNQKALYGQTLSTIAGDYSGTIAFHSALVAYGE